MSSPHSWDELADAFHSALAVPVAERAAWLAAACPSPALRAEVAAMLREHEAPLALEQRLLAAVASAEALPADKSGVTVGAYRLERLLGRGGMGEVYLASRADGHYQGTVAVKLLPAGLADPERERRLRHERQILATLRHPGIATLLDGGVTVGGQPYLVMEHVDGEPIDRHCDHHRLDLAERLQLFARVCDAVHYAHARLVVHRDIKPSNLLVDTTGTPKLLDFGIAKLLEPGGAAVDATVAEQRLFTPLRAAPEQIRGEPISTATDVYGLGVLLFELLTGSLPFRARSGDVWEAYRAVCEDEPLRPSSALGRRGDRSRERRSASAAAARAADEGPASAGSDALEDGRRGSRERAGDGADAAVAAIAAARQVTPAQLRRALRGDLESIVARALAKAPEARYASAGELAAEVRRWLSGEPIAARRQSWLYRGGKFVRRHALPVTAAVLAAVALAAASLVALAAARRAQRERDLAVAGERRAQAAMEVLVDLFALADPAAGPAGDQVSIDDLLARAERRSATLPDPLLQARLFHDLGRIQRERTHYPAAARLLQRAQQTAAASGDAVLREEVDLQLGMTRRELFELDAARRLLAGVVARRRDRLGPDAPATLEAERELATALPAEEAVPALEDLLARQRRLLGAGSSALTRTLHALCSARWDSGDTEGALRAGEEALVILRRTGGESTPLGLGVLNNVATMTPDPRRQEQVQRRRLEVGAAVYGSESVMVAEAWNNLATALAWQGRLAEAEEGFARALTLYEKRYGAAHRATANALRNVGRMRQVRGHPEEGLPLLRRALAITEANGGDDRTVAGLRTQVSRAAWVVERTPAGLAAVRTATAAVVALPTHRDDRYRVDALTLLGMTLSEAGGGCEAVPVLRDALERRGGVAATQTPGYAVETRCALLDAERTCGEAGPSALANELAWCRRELPRWGLADPELLARLRR